MSKGIYNQQGRRSGGYKKANIVVGESKEFKPLLGFACFEGRHKECKEDKNHCRCWCHSSYDGFWYRFFCQGCGNEVSTTDKKLFAEKLCLDCETKKYEIHN